MYEEMGNGCRYLTKGSNPQNINSEIFDKTRFFVATCLTVS